jgi:hypothetical protein
MNAIATLSEQEKYTLMWSHEEYRRCSPGEGIGPHFLHLVRPKAGSEVIDFGTGTGRGALMLALLGHLKVHMVDFAANCLDEDVRDACTTQSHALDFTQADLSKPIPLVAEYGYCTDVLEHIPPDQVDTVLKNILQAAQHVFFQISTVDDSCGVLIGEKLHLSVHEAAWWLKKFMDLQCQVHYFRDQGDSCIAYVTAWAAGKEIVSVGELNVEEAKIRENVRANCRPHYQHILFAHKPDTRLNDFYKQLKAVDSPEWHAALEVLKMKVPEYGDLDPVHGDIWHLEGVHFGPFPAEREGSDYTAEGYVDVPARDIILAYWWGNSNLGVGCSMKEWEAALLKAGGELQRWRQVYPHDPNDVECMIVGGGPSLAGKLEEIKRLRSEGVKLITLNGAYNWALEHGLKVSATVVVDARPFNARFTHPVVDETQYLIGSQCDPSVLEGLPHERTWLWNTTAEAIQDILEEEVGPGKWFGVVGGCTVLLRAIPLMRMLGYRKFHLFGCDSCVFQPGINHGGGEYGFQPIGTPEHHAYAQPENDGTPVFDTIVGGRKFLCTAWQTAQATEFIELVRVMGNEFEIEVHGDGLLAWILQHGYNLDVESEETTELQKREAKRPRY